MAPNLPRDFLSFYKPQGGLMPLSKQKNKKPWLNFDGTTKTDEELKEVSKEWTPKNWEAYLSEQEQHQREEPHPHNILESIEEKISPEELARGIFSYVSECNLPHFKPFVAEAIATLSPRELKVIQGVYWDSKTYREIAVQIGVTKAGAYKIHSRALEKLRLLIPKVAFQEKPIKSKAS